MNTLPSPTRRAALAAGIGAFALLAAGCGRRESLVELPGNGAQVFRGLTMGSSYTVKIASKKLSETALAAAKQAVAAALGEVVATMSHYEPGSELSRLNRHPLGEPLAVSPGSFGVFEVAQRVHAASEGAFDVAIGRAVDAWGFGPSDRPRLALPLDAVVELRRDLQRRPAGGALALDVRAGTVTRQAPVLANLSGIAKGHGVDRAADALDALGLGDYMVEVGGEIRTRGRNAQGRPWQLAIERPDAMPQQALLIVPLEGRSLATSGDYRNYFEQGGRRYSHEIDPSNAEPVSHALASVSVVADDCTHADAWSTALFVLGPDRGLAAAERLGLAAHFVLRRPDGSFAEMATPAFAALGARTVG